MSARTDAAARGLVVYTGSRECRHCGSLERYTSNGACPQCYGHKSKLPPLRHIERLEARENKSAAVARGERRYMGTACATCGGRERLVSNSGCVACQGRASRQSYENRRAMYHSDVSPLLWINEPPAPELAPLYMACPEVPEGWHVVYSDLGVSRGMRVFTGTDVFARPEVLVFLANEYQRGARLDHHETARRLMPSIMAAMKYYNDGLKRR